jgi:hypothetical protein
VALNRRPLLMETGPYGGGGGGRSAGGFATPISARRFNTWPFVPNAKLLMQKAQEADRRRQRLRELALGWFTHGPTQGSTAATPGSGQAPGSIF